MTLDLILIGLAITLEPIPLTAFILVLASKGGVRKGSAFIFGWLLSLAVVIAVTLLATGDKPPKSGTAPSLAALAVKLVIGVTLVIIGGRRYRRIGQPKKPKKEPRWQSGIDSMSPLYVIGLAPLVQPWGLVAAGVTEVVGAKLSSWESYLVLVLFCIVSTGAYLGMELFVAFNPDAGRAFLARMRTWIDTHTDQIIIVVSLTLGFWLIAKSIYSIVS